MPNESQLLNDIIRALYPWVHLNRCNVGRVRTSDGRWFSTGLPAGHPDLCGTISKDLTGLPVSLPVFIEAKVGRNRLSEVQAEFIATECGKGSLAGVCYSVEDALGMVLPHILAVHGGWKNGEEAGAVDSDGGFIG